MACICERRNGRKKGETKGTRKGGKKGRKQLLSGGIRRVAQDLQFDLAEDFVVDVLHAILEQPKVFQDRRQIRFGVGFWNQIPDFFPEGEHGLLSRLVVVGDLGVYLL